MGDKKLYRDKRTIVIRQKPLNFQTLITSDRQKCLDDDLSIYTLSFKKRKSCKKLYIEFCLKKLLIHFQQRFPGSLIFMAPSKTHKATLGRRPILSSTETYNDNLAEWLEEKLKPLSINEYTITDAFAFADEIRTHSMNDEAILVSCITLYSLHSSLTFTMSFPL